MTATYEGPGPDATRVCSLLVTPDGSRVVSGDEDGAVRVWDLDPLRLTTSPLVGHTGAVSAVAITPDGSSVISGGQDGTIRRWGLGDERSGAAPIDAHPGQVCSLAVTPDGARLVSGGDDGTVRVWDLATGAQLGRPLAGHISAVYVAVTPDGSRIVSGGADGTLQVWDLATMAPTGEPLAQRGAPGQPGGGAIRALAITPDGTRVVSGGADGALRFWDLTNRAPLGEPQAGHNGGVESLAVSRDGAWLVSGGADSELRVWDLANGTSIGEPLHGGSDVRSIALTPDGRWAVSGGDDGLRVQYIPAANTTDESLRRSWFAHSRLSSVAVTSDGARVVSGGLDGTVQVWDLASGAPVSEPLSGHKGGVDSVAVSPDGTRVVSGGLDGTVRVWDLASGAPVGEPLAGHHEAVWSVAVTSDGARVVSGGRDGTVRVWDLASGAPVGEPLTGHRGDVFSAAVSPDGAWVVSGGADGMVRVWDLASGAPVGEPLTGHQGGVFSVAVSPDGARVVSGGRDGTVRVWDLASGAPVGEPLTGHHEAVGSVAVTPDGAWVVSGGADGTVRVWDLASGALVGEPLPGHQGGVGSVAVTPDGARLVSGGADGTLRVWEPFGPPRTSWYAGVLTDAESAVDRLGMIADVQTLAALLAATSTAPPLSVALMGNWGSGKSTFMRLLIDEVHRLTHADQPVTAYTQHVRQVRFNAWHYSDDHLWVGLIEHLFRELRRDPDDPTQAPTSRHNDATQRTLADMRARLAAAKAQHDRTRDALKEVDALDPDKAGWLGWLGQIRRAFTVTWAVADDLRSRLRTKAVATSAVLAILTLGGILTALTYGPALHTWLQSLAWAATATAAIATVVAPLRQVWNAATRWTIAARKELMIGEQQGAATIRRLEEELTQLDPARQLDQLLTEISADARYASYRGLTGRIHHDLQRLNQQLAVAHRDDPAQQWRIILYIDDLDRCTSERVVEVLQAVNLLLSMELFLVVVAVDPRWLLRALDEKHGTLLNAKPTVRTDAGDRDKYGRALDYLDKIFHVPYAVRPAGGHATTYLRSLLPEPEPEPAPPGIPDNRTPLGQPAATNDDRPREEGPSAPAADQPAFGGAVEVPDPVVGAASASTTASATITARVRPPGPLTTENLRLRQAELDFLPELAPLLSTPRAIKKLANLYRLVRIAVPTDELPVFLGDIRGGPYQAAALLLASLISDPGEAGDLLNLILDRGAAEDAGDIVNLLRGAPEQTGAQLALRLAAFIEDLRAARAVHGDPATYRAWARTVARYSFETYEMFA